MEDKNRNGRVMKKKSTEGGKSSLVYILFLSSSITLLIVAVIFAVLINDIEREKLNSIQTHLRVAAQRAATYLTVEELDLFHTAEDMQRPEWDEIRTRLQQLAEESAVLYVYYWRYTGDGHIQYIIDNDEDEEEMVTPEWIFSLDEDPATAEAVVMIQAGESWVTDLGVYTDSWDGLLSAAVPVFNNDGTVYCAAGVDVSDEILISMRNSSMIMRIALIVSLLTSIASGFFGMRAFNKKKVLAEEATISLGKQLKIINEGIRYASKIQMSIIPDNEKLDRAFSDYSIIWKPRDVVGGDIYWAKNFDDGTVLCVCDCTGHGTPGALLTMLVVSAFESTITEQSHKNTAEILYMLDKRLAAVLNVKTDKEEYTDINDGCDLAVMFIANDGNVTISSGNTNVFVCDGKKVTRHRGQKIYVGEGKIKNVDRVKTISIPADPVNKFYIASDGLYDQIGGDDKIPYGYDEFERIILEKHNETHSVISDRIWQSFENYRGDNARRDDFELITFTPKIEG